jgi:cell division transport system permease protein
MNNNPSTFHLLDKTFKLALSNIWRNKILSLATVFVMGTIIFVFNIILSVNFIAQDALQDLSRKVDINVYLRDSVNHDQVRFLVGEIERIEQVEKVEYISKENALQRLKVTHPNISLAFEQYDLGNPLPASLNITTVHPQYHQAIRDFLTKDEYQLYLSGFASGEDSSGSDILSSVSENLLNLTVFTRQLIFWLIMTFLVGGALIMINAIQITIFMRKKEISVMKLVGASHNFIRSPFVMESMIYAICAVLFGFFMLMILANNVGIQESGIFDGNFDFTTIFFVELIITIALSFFSSVIVINEYIKRDLIDD